LAEFALRFIVSALSDGARLDQRIDGLLWVSLVLREVSWKVHAGSGRIPHNDIPCGLVRRPPFLQYAS
jgi:hypothetical protein